MVICLQRGANDLHMVQLMPLPPHHLLLHYNPDWFNLSGASLPRLSRKRGRYTGLFTVIMAKNMRETTNLVLNGPVTPS